MSKITAALTQSRSYFSALALSDAVSELAPDAEVLRLIRLIDEALEETHLSGEATEMVQEPMFKVGNLVTVNSDPYPALGHLFVQLWDGDDLVARVYADDEQTLHKRVSALNAARSNNK